MFSNKVDTLPYLLWFVSCNRKGTHPWRPRNMRRDLQKWDLMFNGFQPEPTFLKVRSMGASFFSIVLSSLKSTLKIDLSFKKVRSCWKPWDPKKVFYSHTKLFKDVFTISRNFIVYLQPNIYMYVQLLNFEFWAIY